MNEQRFIKCPECEGRGHFGVDGKCSACNRGYVPAPEPPALQEAVERLRYHIVFSDDDGWWWLNQARDPTITVPIDFPTRPEATEGCAWLNAALDALAATCADLMAKDREGLQHVHTELRAVKLARKELVGENNGLRDQLAQVRMTPEEREAFLEWGETPAATEQEQKAWDLMNEYLSRIGALEGGE
jgi:hypothetical protein